MGSEDGGGCARCGATLWLILFNSLFALLGLGVIAVGCLLRWNSQLFETYIVDILSSSEVDGVNLKSIMESVAIIFIVVGLIITAIAILGIIGGCCKMKMALTIYSLVMIKLLILEIVLIILFIAFKDKIDSNIKGALQTTLDTFKGYNSTEPVTVGWNYVFSKFECCGIDGYNDLSTASNWPMNITYGGTPYMLSTPVFCCKHSGTYPSVTLPADLACAESPSSNSSNYMAGCYDAVEDYVMGYRIAMIVGVACIMACEFFGLIATCILKSKANQVEDVQR